ncbi:MAG: hypothetical protein U0L37_04080 [Bacteroidales bacterium]|nr:hypothetical protein [Bacteroidales bacterium]MEE1001115.1 hypothetical protein [Bacteroidales bacterium]
MKVERSSDKSFRAESASCGEYSARKPFTFQALYLTMQTATETIDRQKCNPAYLNLLVGYDNELMLIVSGNAI